MYEADSGSIVDEPLNFSLPLALVSSSVLVLSFELCCSLVAETGPSFFLSLELAGENVPLFAAEAGRSYVSPLTVPVAAERGVHSISRLPLLGATNTSLVSHFPVSAVVKTCISSVSCLQYFSAETGSSFVSPYTYL